MSSSGNRAVLVILDGFGIGIDSPYNAINNAQKLGKMPFYRELSTRYPHSQLITHGLAVGLPEGIMGNSEVGHMTMGAGRIIYQDLTRITKSIHDKDFFTNPVLTQAIDAGKGRVHLMGLLSDGGVHSHIDHLLALLDLCMQKGAKTIAVHAFLDGRDTPPNSSVKYLKKLLEHPAFAAGRATIATVSGRYWAMDRDKRWDRVAKAYMAMTGQIAPWPTPGPGGATPAAIAAVEKSWADGKTDEFVEPTLLDPNGAMQDGDGVIFFNYRADRAREISHAILDRGFTEFDRGRGFKPSFYAGMTSYEKKLEEHGLQVAYGPQNLNNIFGKWLEDRSLKQFRTAETEKYAHVTFFFNGGREAPFNGEDRTLIPSNKEVATYDLHPEMSAFGVAAEARRQIEKQAYDFVLMNFANADMVGHTGNYEATVRSMEALDRALAEVVGAAEKNGYHTLITADHGNAEEMVDCNGHLHTQHTLNPVPAIWVAPNSALAPRTERVALKDGTLADVMPTLCDFMKLPLPKEVTGKSLLP